MLMEALFFVANVSCCIVSFFLSFVCLFFIWQKGRVYKRLSSQLVTSCQHCPALPYEKRPYIPSGQTRTMKTTMKTL